MFCLGGTHYAMPVCRKVDAKPSNLTLDQIQRRPAFQAIGKADEKRET